MFLSFSLFFVIPFLTAFLSQSISLLPDMFCFFLADFFQSLYHIILSLICLLQSCLPSEISMDRTESQAHVSLCIHRKPPYFFLGRFSAEKASGLGNVPVFHSFFFCETCFSIFLMDFYSQEEKLKVNKSGSHQKQAGQKRRNRF